MFRKHYSSLYQNFSFKEVAYRILSRRYEMNYNVHKTLAFNDISKYGNKSRIKNIGVGLITYDVLYIIFTMLMLAVWIYNP